MKITPEATARVQSQISVNMARYGENEWTTIRRLWAAKAELIAEEAVLGETPWQPRLEDWAYLHSLILAARDMASGRVSPTQAQDWAGRLAATEPDVAHECGTPAEGKVDTSDYPVPIVISQRDPADSESWVFRCYGGHPSVHMAMSPCYGWQSPDYASEGGALIGAADHARTMHDGGLPAELAERATAAERAAAGADPAPGTQEHAERL